MSGQSSGGNERTATPEEIEEYEEEHGEPHPVFEVDRRPERQKLEFKDCPQDTDTDRPADH